MSRVGVINNGGALLLLLITLAWTTRSFLLPSAVSSSRRASKLSMAATIDPSTKTSKSSSSPSSGKMEVVQVELGDRSYPIYIGPGLLKKAELLTNHISGKRSFIITNDVSRG